MQKILIVEDEISISQVLKVYLRNNGFLTEQVFRGNDALDYFHTFKPDLVLLDIMLPGKDGWTILKEIRAESMCPVIMLTALSDSKERINGLNEGADDYIPKPFVAEEVVARVQAVLRRGKSVEEKKNREVKFGNLEIDLLKQIVQIDGEIIYLTPRDLSVLCFLAKHPNQTFTREQMIENIWGLDYEGSDRAVDLSIKRLRKALSRWDKEYGEIRTQRGLGYQLSVYV